jgi:hypothetical protein
VTPAEAGLSSRKSKNIRPVLIASFGLSCTRSWCEIRFEFETKYSPAISPCHQVPQS